MVPWLIVVVRGLRSRERVSTFDGSEGAVKNLESRFRFGILRRAGVDCTDGCWKNLEKFEVEKTWVTAGGSDESRRFRRLAETGV